MKAIEFITQIKDGAIEVPTKHLENLKGKVRVIILVEPPDKKLQIIGQKKQLKSIKVKTKGLRFDRVEANER